MTKNQLIELVHKIMDPMHNEWQRAAWLQILSQNVPHPEVSDLIFWPQNHDLGFAPTAEEIVDKALNYKPIIL